MKSIDSDVLKELLHKGWMTHDAMWFFHCMQEFGMEKTNKINKAAVKSMAMVEIKRIAKILDVNRIDSFEKFKEFIECVYGVVKAEFMKFDYSFPENGVLRMVMKECFAYDGMIRIGAIGEYQCGIFERIEGWLHALEVDYIIEPKMDGCMMHEDGHCYRNFRVNFRKNTC